MISDGGNTGIDIQWGRDGSRRSSRDRHSLESVHIAVVSVDDKPVINLQPPNLSNLGTSGSFTIDSTMESNSKWGGDADNVVIVTEDEDVILSGGHITVNDVDLIPGDYETHVLVCEVEVLYGTFSLTMTSPSEIAFLKSYNLPENARGAGNVAEFSSHKQFAGTIEAINRAFHDSVYRPAKNWNSMNTNGPDRLRITVNSTKTTNKHELSDRIYSIHELEKLDTDDTPNSFTISKTSFTVAEIFFVVEAVSSGPVIILPTQLAHLHDWHTYHDDLSRIIVSIDRVDTLEDTPVSIEGISVRDVDAEDSPQHNGFGTVVVTISVSHGTISLAALGASSSSLNRDASQIAHVDRMIVGSGSSDETVSFEASVPEANVALSHLTYTPLLNYHGFDSLVLKVNDTANSGAGGWMVDAQTIPLQVLAATMPQ